MSRSKRIVAILPAVLLLVLVLPNWWSSLRDYSPIPVVLAVLLILCA